MTTAIHIKTADLAVGDRSVSISTGSIGSCVIIVLWDPQARIGGLAHAMLPHRRVDDDRTHPAKYVDEAIDALLDEVIKHGASPAGLQAKIIGGATMFHKISNPKSVGQCNVEAARAKLSARSIFVDKEDVGGNSGRTVTFDIASGVVDIHSAI